MPAVGLTTWIWENQLKTLFIVFLFPVSVLVLVFLMLLVFFYVDPTYAQQLEISSFDMAVYWFIDITTIAVPVFAVWFVLSVLFHRSIVFSLSGAQKITRKQNPYIYNIVENLCISRGLPVPHIGIMPDRGMNAFATGWSPENSWIVFSQGLLDTLTTEEIEAVAAHELTHIINRDVRLMTILVVFVGIISIIASILMRVHWFSGSSDRKGDGRLGLILLIVGLVLYLFSLSVLPLMRLAVSRKREFLADAGAVELTHNADAMISALRKISQQSTIESLKNKASLSAMCIEDATGKQKKHKKTSLFSTHPSLADRIAALELQ